ncbi:PA-phosphatase [Spirosoma sp. KUDC1026]|uniref:PA-phosphatase n=1 Tax=Spirosoma sp. KUDC1026 TaxID=2745947 RepID=UPI00159BCC23|nr:PA-phosphatase [Spirosoma sp. KUDC1026]QKZ11130.1 PA-phosphatase [Spirosoma sp. KUDC1026]
MKNYKQIVFVCALALSLAGCKEPAINEGILPLYEPATVDAGGGNWQTIVLTSGAEVSVPAPLAVTSTSYQNELAELKNTLYSIDPAKSTSVNYWGTGGVVRWNQIARLLVSKYNLAPTYNSPTSQFSDPQAARLFALLSVAQYDALVVAWRAKYQYNRPSILRQDVTPRIPIADVPSYPSEDAAIAEVSCRVLAYFFPSEATWLQSQAADHKQSRIWAGANVASDVKAGEELAVPVATKVLTRAQSDRFSQATDPGNTWQAKRTAAPYDQKWTSLALPAEAPLLPLAGNITTWYNATTIAQSVPAAPALTTSAPFQQALAEVRTLSDSRTRDQYRIATAWADGAGTYTAVGHWNRLAEEQISYARQNELRAARSYALLNRTLQDVTTACWGQKYQYFVPRPSQGDANIKTVSPIPNYPSYPSVRSAYASAATSILLYLFPSESIALNRQAGEATLAPLYAGTQYRFSVEAGTKWGNGISSLAIAQAKSDGAN